MLGRGQKQLSSCRSFLTKAVWDLLLQVFMRSSYAAVICTSQFAKLTEHHIIGSPSEHLYCLGDWAKFFSCTLFSVVIHDSFWRTGAHYANRWINRWANESPHESPRMWWNTVIAQLVFFSLVWEDGPQTFFNKKRTLSWKPLKYETKCVNNVI